MVVVVGGIGTSRASILIGSGLTTGGGACTTEIDGARRSRHDSAAVGIGSDSRRAGSATTGLSIFCASSSAFFLARSACANRLSSSSARRFLARSAAACISRACNSSRSTTGGGEASSAAADVSVAGSGTTGGSVEVDFVGERTAAIDGG